MPTMPPSSIGVALRKAVADGLAEHLGNLSDFNGVAAAEHEVAVGFAYDFSNRPREQVYTGRSSADTPPAGMRSGRNTRNESGHFDLNVMVRSVGEDAYAAEARAEAIGGAIEDWFADRKSNQLGVPGLVSLVVESWTADYAQTDQGAAALRTYDIRWTARLE